MTNLAHDCFAQKLPVILLRLSPLLPVYKMEQQGKCAAVWSGEGFSQEKHPLLLLLPSICKYSHNVAYSARYRDEARRMCVGTQVAQA